MANDNETVEQLCADIKTRIEELWEQSLGAMLNGEVDEFADRILAAHKREIGELKGERKGILKANEAFAADNTRLRGELAAKDEEILNLRKSLARVMEVTGDCRKCEECGDETCPWFGEPDGCNNREGRALFLAGKLVDPLKMKDAEIAKLRALVKELADALEERLCDFDCETNGKCRCPADMKREECESFNMRPLVARAREVAK